MGRLVKAHLPCKVDGCGSSDAAAIYEDEDSGRQYSICFSPSCPSDGGATYLDGTINASRESQEDDSDTLEASEGTSKLVLAMQAYGALGEAESMRDISARALQHYGIRTDGKGTAYFPYFEDGELIGFKVRRPPKKFSKVGGDIKNLLFGIQAFRPGGKAVTITEGEGDAASVYEMFGCKYPAVSASNTSSIIEACKANYEWLSSFESIYICMDADAAGQKDVQELAALFSGKAKIVTLDKKLKDPNGYLMAGKTKEFIAAWWAATAYVPDGIVRGSTLRSRMGVKRADPIVAWPWIEMNDKLYGIYGGRIYTLTAGSGVGKSQVVRELSYWVMQQTDHNIGLMMLEESVEDTCLGLMSLYLNKPLHVPSTEYNMEEYDEAFNATGGTDRFIYHDHFGSTSTNNVLDRVRYMAKAEGCKFIFLDHLSIIVSAQQNADERKAIDEIMTKLRMLVQETGTTLFLVSHLKRTDKKDYTRGAEVSTSDLRGSASIEQLSDCIIALERDGQAETEQESNTTLLRILKSRQFGRLGPADSLYYDHRTGRMVMTNSVDTL